LLLDLTVDYTSNGSAVTLTSGAAAGDEIEVVAYNTFSVGDALPKSGGAMTGALDMNGTELVLDADGDTSITADTDDRIDFKIAGSDRGNLHYDGNDFFSLESNDYLTLVQNQTAERGLILGPTYFKPYNAHDNTLDLGIGAARWKDLYLSGGAYIGGTGAANKLDDYEEGSWTPVITASGGSTNATMTVGGNTYTKVGSLVVANAYLSSVNMGAITNGTYFIMTGFPYVAREYADFSISYKDGDHSASTTISGGYVQKNTSYAYFVTANNGSEPQQTSSAAFTRAMITFVYLTT